MALKPSTVKCSKNSMVNRHIGTAYDDVRLVAENIDDVVKVANADFDEVLDNIDDIIAAVPAAEQAKQSAAEALLSEQEAKASEDASKASELEAQRLLNLLTPATDVELARIVAEGDSQLIRVEAEGDTQFGRSSEQADRAYDQANRSENEADRAEDEADRAEGAMTDLDNAIRQEGYFAPSIGIYPIPEEQHTPSTWFANDGGDVGGVTWGAGDMLMYVPDQTNPEGVLGSYFRVAGELSEPGEPGPIEILDNLIMQKKKFIGFRKDDDSIVEALKLDLDGDLILGDEKDPVNLNKLGLAAHEIFHILNIDPDTGQATELYKILTEEGGLPVRVIGDEGISGTKTFNSNPRMSVSQASSGNALTRKDWVEGAIAAQDASYVKVSGNQTITGTKTFTVNPISTGSQGTGSQHLTRRDFVLGIVSDVQSDLDNLRDEVDTAVEGAATKTYVDNANTAQDIVIGTKAFTVDVDSKNALQDTEIGTKASTSYVDGLDEGNLKLAGNQSITGQKTFLFPPVLGTGSAMTSTDGHDRMTFIANGLTRVHSGVAIDSGAVPLFEVVDANGTPIVQFDANGGIVTLGVVSADNHVATKKYVDDHVPEDTGGGAWGEITGTLSDQTDLQAKFDTTVKLSGAQTVAGGKTFSSNIQMGAAAPGASNHLTRKDYVDGLPQVNNTADTAVKRDNGKQIYVSVVHVEDAPAASDHATRRDYVDSADSNLQQQIDGLSGGITLKGETTVATLNALGTSNDIGDLWSMTDGGTLTQGNNPVLAGDQVAWADSNEWIDFGGASVSWGSVQGDLSDQIDLQSALDAKDTISSVNSKVAPKEDTTAVNAKLALKADTTYVDSELADKADITYVDGALAGKDDITSVNTKLSFKDDSTVVDAKLVPKANITYVDSEIGILEDDIQSVDDKYDALDTGNVKLTGAQSIAGNKTFSNHIKLLSEPVSWQDAARKGYVDDLVSGVLGVKADITYVDAQDVIIAGTVTTVDGRVTTLDGQVVKLTGSQSIGGTKTYNNALVLNTGSSIAAHATRKDYVDAADTALGIRIDNINSGGTEVSWGSITGDLTTQSDLWPILDWKTDKDYVDDLDRESVKLTGFQTIDGGKTFEQAVYLVAAPTNDGHATRRDYVDLGDFTLQQQIDALAGGVQIQGEATVAEVNALGTSSTVGHAWLMTDTGTLTQGNNFVEPGDLVLWDAANEWLDFGNQDINALWGSIQGTLADQTDLVQALAVKESTVNVDAKLALKDSIVSVDAKVLPKADITYVDTELDKYDTTIESNAKLALKADASDLGAKADTTYVDGLDADNVKRDETANRWPTGDWIRDDQGTQRITYNANGSTIQRSGNAVGEGDIFTWRDRTNSTVMTMNSSGNLDLQVGNFTSDKVPVNNNHLPNKLYTDDLVDAVLVDANAYTDQEVGNIDLSSKAETTYVDDADLVLQNQIDNLPTGGGAWGEITGTISDQTDLQTELDAKTKPSDLLTMTPATFTYVGGSITGELA